MLSLESYWKSNLGTDQINSDFKCIEYHQKEDYQSLSNLNEQ